jgi:hypothetical protein
MSTLFLATLLSSRWFPVADRQGAGLRIVNLLAWRSMRLCSMLQAQFAERE